MNHNQLRERLRQQTGRVAAEHAEAQPRALSANGLVRPGDLLVLPNTAELPVEWLVLEAEPGPPARLLLVAVDTSPLRGPGELAIPAAGITGPLTLRCHHSQWLDAEVLAAAPDRLSGRLSPEQLERAQKHFRKVQDGTLEASLDEEETALDPEYQDWVTSILDPACQRLGGAAGKGADAAPAPVVPIRPPRRRTSAAPTWLYALAASLLIATVSLSVALVQARRQALEPALIGQVVPVSLTLTRSPVEPVELPPDAHSLILNLSLPRRSELKYELVRLVLREDHSGRELWRSPELDIETWKSPQLNLHAPQLRQGNLRLQLYNVGPDSEELFQEQVIEIRQPALP